MHLKKKLTEQISEMIHECEEEIEESGSSPEDRVLLYGAIHHLVEAGRRISDTTGNRPREYRGNPAEEGMAAAREENRQREFRGRARK